MDTYFENVENVIKKMFNNINVHDYEHIKRVLSYARKIQLHEGGDLRVIELSALLHDVHRYIEFKEKCYCDPKDSIKLARSILEQCNVDVKLHDAICHCIECHEVYSFSAKAIKTKSIEAKIIQDADNIDAVGAIGIARVFSYGGYLGEPIIKNEKALQLSEEYIPSLKSTSTIHHFYNKLLNLKDGFNTETGKLLAQEKIKYMEAFMSEFISEIEASSSDL